ncbi:hypothetical protein [Allokutzneria sp. NRRL B-24872]|uniref:hypothetical protein n=1 Tax=Allokutzneria sp. NRRL B-24872 TaxID=1137961 RepID=UPI00143D6D00|nr:hypothetical protein [Allokutzneria sp. NRRL B-24872]
MSSARPQEPFFTVAFGVPVNISLLARNPSPKDGESFTVAWRAKIGTTVLPYDRKERS